MRQKIKSLGAQVRRQAKRTKELEDTISELKSKPIPVLNVTAEFEKHFDGVFLELLKNEALNKKCLSSSGNRFSEEVRNFAATLFYNSPQAYKYCSTIFTLPNPSTIRNWYRYTEHKPEFPIHSTDE